MESKLLREENFLMACRFAYYCMAESIIQDKEYDIREKEFINAYRLSSALNTPGADTEHTYTNY